MAGGDSIPRIDVTVDEEDLFGGAAKILEAIRPEWERGRIVFKMLTDGITNKLVKCSLEGVPDFDSLLVRVYGNKTDLLIDRKAETKNIILLNKVTLAPRLYATFNNGLAYEFVPGCTLHETSVRQPQIYSLVAKRMARLHQVTISGCNDPEPVLWKKMNEFFNLVPDVFTDNDKHKRYEEKVLSKARIREEIELLKEKLDKLDSPVVFCHNDLLLGNVVHTAEKNSVTFIDFEYSTFNYQAFDLGNHFNEFAGVDEVDYTRYPDKLFQYKWLKEYLSVIQENATQRDLEVLYIQVNQFSLASHIFWGVWALIQAEHSYIDFDFMGYAALRFNQYLNTKEAFLSLELPR